MRMAWLALLAAPAFAQTVTISPCAFSGSGLNDATCGGRYTPAPANSQYVVTISATGTPDHFKWSKNGGSLSSTIAITGAAQTLTDGVTIEFAATTGHTAADTWTTTVTASGSSSGQSYISTGVGASFRPSQEKLREVLSVLDFGADPAGVKDSAAAFNAASVAARNGGNCGHIFIPRGSYLLGSTWTVGGCVGLEIYGTGKDSEIVWNGNNSTPELFLQGCWACDIHGFRMQSNSTKPLLEAIEVSTGTPSGAAFGLSSRDNIHDVVIDGTGTGGLTYGVMVDGPDSNNDFHHIHDTTVTNFTDTAIWLKGSQAYGIFLENNLLQGGGFGLYGVKATNSAGGGGGAAAGFHWIGGGIGTVTSDFYIDGFSSGSGYLMQYLNSESYGKLLTATGVINGNVVITGPSRWIKTSDSTDNDPVMIDFSGGALRIDDLFASNQSTSATTGQTQFFYHFSAGINGIDAMVVNRSLIQTTNHTPASIFASGSDALGSWFQATGFQWVDPTCCSGGTYSLGSITAPPQVFPVSTATETTIITATPDSATTGNGADLRAYQDSGPETDFYMCQRTTTTCVDFMRWDFYTGAGAGAPAFQWMRPGPFALAASCPSSAPEGSIAAITDSTTNTWGAIITGSGSDHVMAYCDGTGWTVMGK